MRPIELRLACATVALLAGCVPPASPPEEAAAVPAAQAVAPQPQPLPPLSPPYRLQREIEAMSDADLARWILGGEAHRIAEAELIPPRWGRLGAGILWEAPRPAGPPGVCEAAGSAVWFAIENESSLTPQAFVDPPLRPYQLSPERRWKVVGSTLAAPPSAAACAAAKPYWQWPTAPSAAALHDAARLMEQAEAEARSRRVGYAYRCTQQHYPEGAETATERHCPQGTIQKFTPDRIRSVKAAACSGPLAKVRSGRCWEIDYELREGDGYYYYTALIGGADRPKAVAIAQYVPPPH